jgi:mRNA interferase MazF
MGTDQRLIKRGEVYLARFDPAEGSEIQKTRPAVVIQNNLGNQASPTTILAPISVRSGKSLYLFEVAVDPPDGGLVKHSSVLLNQIRTMDKKRLGKRLGVLKPETITKVDQALAISLGLVEF